MQLATVLTFPTKDVHFVAQSTAAMILSRKSEAGCIPPRVILHRVELNRAEISATMRTTGSKYVLIVIIGKWSISIDLRCRLIRDSDCCTLKVRPAEPLVVPAIERVKMVSYLDNRAACIHQIIAPHTFALFSDSIDKVECAAKLFLCDYDWRVSELHLGDHSPNARIVSEPIQLLESQSLFSAVEVEYVDHQLRHHHHSASES